jgi:hypothetical protein
MSRVSPTLTFHVSVPSKASPDAIYDVLSDLNTHLVWAGERSPNKNFHLLTMEAPSRSVTVGERFSSNGENGHGTPAAGVTSEGGERGEPVVAPGWPAPSCHQVTS